MSRNQLFGCEMLTTCRKSEVLTMKFKKMYLKNQIIKNQNKNCVYGCPQFVRTASIVDTIHFRLLDKNYPYFGHLLLQKYYDGNSSELFSSRSIL